VQASRNQVTSSTVLISTMQLSTCAVIGLSFLVAMLSSSVDARKTAQCNSYYLGEYQKLYDAKLTDLPGSKILATFGMLPSGTAATINDTVAAVVVGDSFAGPLAGALNDIAVEHKLAFTMTSIPSCAAFFDKDSIDETKVDWPNVSPTNTGPIECKRSHRMGMLELIKKSDTNLVVLAANWLASPQLYKSMRGVENPVLDTVRVIRATGRNVVIIGVVPGAHYNVRSCLEASGPMSLFTRCAETSRVIPPFQGEAPLREKMEKRVAMRMGLARIVASEEMQQLGGVGFVDPFNSLCPQKDFCMNIENEDPLYSDAMHLTAAGGRKLRSDIEKMVLKYA
jgi:hypothetical protein